VSAFEPHPPHEELLALALGEVDDGARATFEVHLEGCETCRQEYLSMIETLATVSYAAPSQAPPVRLRAAILDAVATEPRSVPTPEPRRAGRWAGWAGWGGWVPRVAIGAGALVATILVIVTLTSSSVSTQTVPLNGVTGTVLVTNHTAVLETADFRPLPAGRVYELWVIHDGSARAAGLFGIASLPVAVRGPVVSGDTVAVTQEPAGGSLQPTSTPLATARI
jgi:anti-sigma-K factor RskA